MNARLPPAAFIATSVDTTFAAWPRSMLVAAFTARLPDFPEALRLLILHIVLSHHGKLEFGSPVVPKTPEALLVHYLDDLDGKLEAMFRGIREDAG